jgi:2-polyprenyl-3-methyl-5-hydroxy-6-metoxy-1,4-benzoquinol methylase
MQRTRSVWLCTCLALLALVQAHAEPRYETRVRHDPDGIGKFYMGREIAHVMGAAGMAWLERPEREAEERPQQVIDALDIRKGQTVADLGAGSGYFSFRMAPKVGSEGKVLAVDIQEEMLNVVRQRAQREGINNVVALRSTTSDAKLAPGSIDLLLMVDVYHELEYPYEVMQSVAKALKPGGRVALVEYRKEDPRVPIKEVHKMSEQQIIKEMAAVGLKHLKTVDTLPIQHLAIFTK